MLNLIIADTSCLILLQKIKSLNLLEKLYGKMTITPIIAEEFGLPLPDWVDIIVPTDIVYQEILEATLDIGEASALALALEHKGSLVIIDDLKGRKFAQSLGLRITGSLGILIAGKKAGHINAIKPVLEEIKTSDFRLSPDLEKTILQLAKE